MKTKRALPGRHLLAKPGNFHCFTMKTFSVFGENRAAGRGVIVKYVTAVGA